MPADEQLYAGRDARSSPVDSPFRVALPYDMGNAGDLLKHGVLAEVVRWQCEQGIQLRFIDLFGGEPWEEPVSPEVARRVRGLATACALRAAQTGIEDGRYYGSGWVVRHVGTAATGRGTVRVLTTDQNQERRKKLCNSGLALITEDFPTADLSDSYAVFENDIIPNTKNGDLALIDPFAEFLQERASTVVPQMATMAQRAAVLLFVLNQNPQDHNGLEFAELLKDRLPGAWHLTCPPLNDTGVQGESRYRAEVVLAARWLSSSDVLWKRLVAFTERLAQVLDLAAEYVPLRVVPPVRGAVRNGENKVRPRGSDGSDEIRRVSHLGRLGLAGGGLHHLLHRGGSPPRGVRLALTVLMRRQGA